MMDLADMIAYQADAVEADNSVNTTGLATASSGADGSSQGGATAARNTDAQSEAPSHTKDQAISLLKRGLGATNTITARNVVTICDAVSEQSWAPTNGDAITNLLRHVDPDVQTLQGFYHIAQQYIRERNTRDDITKTLTDFSLSVRKMWTERFKQSSLTHSTQNKDTRTRKWGAGDWYKVAESMDLLFRLSRIGAAPLISPPSASSETAFTDVNKDLPGRREWADMIDHTNIEACTHWNASVAEGGAELARWYEDERKRCGYV